MSRRRHENSGKLPIGSRASDLPSLPTSATRSQFFCPVYRSCKKKALLQNLLRTTQRFDDIDRAHKAGKFNKRNERAVDRDPSSQYAALDLNELAQKYEETINRVQGTELRYLLEPIKETALRLRQLSRIENVEPSKAACICCRCELQQRHDGLGLVRGCGCENRLTARSRRESQAPPANERRAEESTKGSDKRATSDSKKPRHLLRERGTYAGDEKNLPLRKREAFAEKSNFGAHSSDSRATRLADEFYVQVQDVGTQVVWQFKAGPSTAPDSTLRRPPTSSSTKRADILECYQEDGLSDPSEQRLDLTDDSTSMADENVGRGAYNPAVDSRGRLTAGLYTRSEQIDTVTDLNTGTRSSDSLLERQSGNVKDFFDSSRKDVAVVALGPGLKNNRKAESETEDELCPCGCGYFIDGEEENCSCGCLRSADKSEAFVRDKQEVGGIVITCECDCEKDCDSCFCEVHDTDDGIRETGERGVNEETEETETECLDELRKKIRSIKEENEYLENLVGTCDCSSVEIKKIVEAPPIRATYSGLSAAIELLRAKCCNKDGMIAALAEGLRGSGRFHRLAENLAAPCLAFVHWDFDRNALYTYLRGILAAGGETIQTTEGKSFLETARSQDSQQEPASVSNVPSPTNLRVVQEICQCIFLSWTAPDDISQIAGYQILVNDKVTNYVRSPSRTDAIIASANTKETIKITLHAINRQGVLSNPVTVTYPDPYCICADEL